MIALRPAAKVGIVFGGFVIALAAAMVAMGIRAQLNAADPSQGMQAFGDMVVGLIVFTGLAAFPLGLGLFWLRPVTRFWQGLAAVAVSYALTGPLALLVSGALRPTLGGWAVLGDIRIGTMPLTALALAICTVFAPSARFRWILAGATFLDCVIFAGVVVFKFILSP